MLDSAAFGDHFFMIVDTDLALIELNILTT